MLCSSESEVHVNVVSLQYIRRYKSPHVLHPRSKRNPSVPWYRRRGAHSSGKTHLCKRDKKAWCRWQKAIGSTRQGRRCDVNGGATVSTIGKTRFQNSDPAHEAARHFGRLPMMATEPFPSSRCWRCSCSPRRTSPCTGHQRSGSCNLAPTSTNQRWPRQCSSFHRTREKTAQSYLARRA